MKTPKEWMLELGDAGTGHPNVCCCDRCKNGRETFLLKQDIADIQIEALQWAMDHNTATIRFCNEMALLNKAENILPLKHKQCLAQAIVEISDLDNHLHADPLNDPDRHS